MKVSERGLQFIADHEGVVTKAYRDVVGVWTIGVGHTASAGAPKPVAGMRITREEAMEIFARDIAKFEKRVDKALGKVPQHVFDGATSFDFNTGAIDSASWVNSYRAGKMGEARINFLKWNKPSAIMGRRRDECALIFDGNYGSHSGVAPPSVSTDKEAIQLYQSQLAKLGFYKDEIDGIAGPKTLAAVEEYQRKRGLVVDRIVGPATRASLVRDIAAVLPPVPDAGDFIPDTGDVSPPPDRQPDDPGIEPAEPTSDGGFFNADVIVGFLAVAAAIAAMIFIL